MTPRTFSTSLEAFDPLLCHLQFFPEGPGFLETLNPLPKTGRYSIVPLRRVDSWRLTESGLDEYRVDEWGGSNDGGP